VTCSEFTVSVADGLTTITLDRPDRGNRLTVAGVRALSLTLRDATGPVLLTGAGSDFCLGRDSADNVESADPDVVLGQVLQPILDLYQAVEETPATVVTAVRGRAFGMGFALAAATDVILATPTAQFALPEIHAGFPPLLVLRVIAPLMPRHAAFHLAATGTAVDSAWLASIGLVAALEDDAALGDTARRYALDLGQSAAALKKMLRGRTTSTSASDAAHAGPTLAAFLAARDAQRTRS
jgi:enoyl-CoA hydratase